MGKMKRNKKAISFSALLLTAAISVGMLMSQHLSAYAEEPDDLLPGEPDLYFKADYVLENPNNENRSYLGEHIDYTTVFGNNRQGAIENSLYDSVVSVYLSEYLDLVSDVTIYTYSDAALTASVTVPVTLEPIAPDDPHFSDIRNCDKKFTLTLDELQGGSEFRIVFRTQVNTDIVGAARNYYYLDGKMYKVSYFANEGTGEYIYYANPHNYNALSAADAAINRAGYKFAGWNTAADGSGIGYAVGTPVPLVDDMADPNGVLLYAQWANNTNSSNNTNGGSSNTNSSSSVSSSSASSSSTRPPAGTEDSSKDSDPSELSQAGSIESIPNTGDQGLLFPMIILCAGAFSLLVICFRINRRSC